MIWDDQPLGLARRQAERVYDLLESQGALTADRRKFVAAAVAGRREASCRVRCQERLFTLTLAGSELQVLIIPGQADEHEQPAVRSWLALATRLDEELLPALRAELLEAGPVGPRSRPSPLAR